MVEVKDNSIMKVLDLACGSAKTPGAIGIDSNPDSQADIIHDLDVFPYPFPDNEFDQILCRHGLEHLTNVIKVMEEVHRICRPGGLVHIAGPHFSSCDFYTDPTHRRAFTSRSMDYFVPGTQLFQFKYSHCQFRKRRVLITFFYQSPWLQPWKKIIQRLVNRSSSTQWSYERHLAYLCPAHQVIFELEVVKEA